ncbi:hypothetical protein WN51_06351 [Melipona quadrifasciata]|uniref:Uncharacterized protein n=1 Tax=Melipona quadrifasciata TaxID=166423 RepID=A0A0N1IT41_9HYME|nr:hypothetical protein WN51_06351 [Melipona quadrifasciata]
MYTMLLRILAFIIILRYASRVAAFKHVEIKAMKHSIGDVIVRADRSPDRPKKFDGKNRNGEKETYNPGKRKSNGKKVARSTIDSLAWPRIPQLRVSNIDWHKPQVAARLASKSCQSPTLSNAECGTSPGWVDNNKRLGRSLSCASGRVVGVSKKEYCRREMRTEPLISGKAISLLGWKLCSCSAERINHGKLSNIKQPGIIHYPLWMEVLIIMVRCAKSYRLESLMLVLEVLKDRVRSAKRLGLKVLKVMMYIGIDIAQTQGATATEIVRSTLPMSRYIICYQNNVNYLVLLYPQESLVKSQIDRHGTMPQLRIKRTRIYARVIEIPPDSAASILYVVGTVVETD